MKQDKNNERRDYDECSCSGVDAHNSENDENSDGWQTIQEDCCSCCSSATDVTTDEGTKTRNRDASNGTLPEQNFPDCCERYVCKEEKNGRSRNVRLSTNGAASEEGYCSRRGARNTSDLDEDCDLCREKAFPRDDGRRRMRDDAQEFRDRSCSCAGTSKKTNKKRSRTHRRKNRRGRQTANRNCSCVAVQDQQQYMDYCTCPGYSNSSEAQRATQPAECIECSSASEVRYNSVSCQTCRTEDIQSGGETIVLPRVTLSIPEDRDDCEQCRRERTMFERLSDPAVQSTIDETFRKLIRKTLEMYPAAQRVAQQADNNLNYGPVVRNNVGSLLPQPSLAMELCTCALKPYSQSDTTCTGPCTECAEVPTNCTCEECTDSQGSESCEECAKENMERNICKLCVNDETNVTCEQCATDSDDNNDSGDACCECCKCQCWKNDKPQKDDDFLF